MFPTKANIHLVSHVLQQALDDEADSLVAKEVNDCSEVGLPDEHAVNFVDVVVGFGNLLK